MKQKNPLNLLLKKLNLKLVPKTKKKNLLKLRLKRLKPKQKTKLKKLRNLTGAAWKPD